MIGVSFDPNAEQLERSQIEKEFPLIECASQFSQCFKHTCAICKFFKVFKTDNEKKIKFYFILQKKLFNYLILYYVTIIKL
jgi:hypothetical protein